MDSHWSKKSSIWPWQHGYNSVNRMRHCFVFEPHKASLKWTTIFTHVDKGPHHKANSDVPGVSSREIFFCVGLGVCMNGEHREHVWPNSHPKWLDHASQSSRQWWSRVKSCSQSTVHLNSVLYNLYVLF